MENFDNNQNIEVVQIKKSWSKYLIDYLKDFNFYKSNSNDIETMYKERLSTRLFISLLFIIMICIIIYSSILLRTVNMTIRNPSEKKFKDIYDKYPNTLTCPCSYTSPQYSEFANFQVIIHEVCNSVFISQQWINEIYNVNVSFIPSNDIRTVLSSFWQLVRSFCSIINVSLDDAFSEFHSNNLLSLSAQSQQLLETKIKATLDFVINSAIINLKKNLAITCETISINEPISSLATNYFTYISSINVYTTPPIGIDINATSFADGCSCENLNGCLRSAIIFESDEIFNFANVSGIMFDCLPLDGALASSFECFYESWCLSLIMNVSKTNMRPEPLHIQSRFEHNTSLKKLLDELMIEQITMTVNFSSYYSICNPKYCTYSYIHRFDILFIITFTAGAFGGILTVLKFIAPFLIKLAYWIYSLKNRDGPRTDYNKNQSTNLILSKFFHLCRKLLGFTCDLCLNVG
ncbi:unnamed protein product [Rotaria sp. Silwood2]|nr:unnamed protein product [Rotaria sp. Silwood2]CAF3122228.1 unnamed protein product [Rotaria sp. Silwood2]CAF4455360.1 unnamed protein product [Rotaria sp. Silwood2]